MRVVNLTRAMTNYFPHGILQLLRTMGKVAEQHGCELYLIGGSVRDMLLPGRPFDWDIDVASEDPALMDVAEALREQLGGSLQSFEQFGTAKLRLKDWERELDLDFARARTETYLSPGANPVVAFASMEKDLVRRDFTINAMGICLNPERFGRLLDPFGGLQDLQHQRLRALHDQKFVEDPVRSWRAARFAVGLGFELTPDTRQAVQSAMQTGYFDGFFSARVLRELRKILRKPEPLPFFAKLEELHVWRCLSDVPVYCPSFVDFCRALPRWRIFFDPALAPSVYLLGILVHLPTAEAEALVPQLEMNKAEQLAWRHWVSFVPEALEEADTPAEVYDILHRMSPMCQWLLCALYTGSEMETRVRAYAEHWQHIQLEITGKTLLQWTRPGPHLKEVLQTLLFAKLNGELPTRSHEEERAKALLA